MAVLKVFIVEDNYQTLCKLKDYVEKHPQLSLIGSAVNGSEAMQFLKNEECDLLLLDVHLPDISGIEVLESSEAIPEVIFITAYDRYAVKAFELGALDYLLKPFTCDRFNKAIERVTASQPSSPGKKDLKKLIFNITDRGRQYLIPYEDIFYIASNGKCSIIHTVELDIDISRLLIEMEEKLPGEQFCRIHKKYIVNISKIHSLEHIKSGLYQVNFTDDVFASVPVGRSYVNELKKKMSAL